MIELVAFLEYCALGIAALGCALAVYLMRTDKPGKPKDRPNRRGW